MSDDTGSKHLSIKDFQADFANDWCAGCGDFGVLKALEKTFVTLNLPPYEIAVFSGIGCSGKTPYYLNTYGIHTLHGRLLPFAAGAKLANPALTVIAIGGMETVYLSGPGTSLMPAGVTLI